MTRTAIKKARWKGFYLTVVLIISSNPTRPRRIICYLSRAERTNQKARNALSRGREFTSRGDTSRGYKTVEQQKQPKCL